MRFPGTTNSMWSQAQVAKKQLSRRHHTEIVHIGTNAQIWAAIKAAMGATHHIGKLTSTSK